MHTHYAPDPFLDM